MATQELGAEAKAAIDTASAAAVQDAATSLLGHCHGGQWVDPDSPFIGTPSKAIAALRALDTRVANRYLCEYLAVSTLFHCFDGWSFLGRAMDAEMAADPSTAGHLAYYAELRGAMSLLASQGIGVFDRTHTATIEDRPFKIIEDGGNTHQFIWKALDRWANLGAAHVLFRVVAPHGTTLDEWLEVLHPSRSGVIALAAKLVRQWGFELQRFETDRVLRNLVSYNPTYLVSAAPRSIPEVLQSVIDLWRCCEPSRPGAFHQLDWLLLRHSLRIVFGNGNGGGPSYSERIEEIGQRLDLSADDEDALRRRLSSTDTGSTLLSSASAATPVTGSNYSSQVLARAALMLRLATGCVRTVFDTSQGEVHRFLSRWSAESSVSRRARPSAGASAADSWTDVSEALDRVAEWVSEDAAPKSYFEFWRDRSADAAVLSSTERIFLWGLGL